MSGFHHYVSHDSPIRLTCLNMKCPEFLKKNVRGIAVSAVIAVLFVAVVTGIVVGRDQQVKSDRKTAAAAVVKAARELGRKQAADFLTDGLDTSTDPCSNFYRYACGNWRYRKSTTKPATLKDTLSKMNDEVLDKVRRALKYVDVYDYSTPQAVKTAKHLFRACTGPTYVLIFAKNPIVKMLQTSKMGMWPLLDPKWAQRTGKLSIEALAGHISSTYGVSAFLEIAVMTDWKDVSRHVIYLDQGSLANKTRFAYFNTSGTLESLFRRIDIQSMAEKIAKNAGIYVTPSSLRKATQEMVDFEIELAEVMSDDIAIRVGAEYYNPYTLNRLRTEFPEFDFTALLRHYLPSDMQGVLESGSQGTQDQDAPKIVVMDPGYLRKMVGLLARTPKKTLHNYLVWRVIYSRKFAVPNEEKKDSGLSTFHYKSILETLGASREDLASITSDVETSCAKIVRTSLPHAVGRLFIDSSYNQADHPYIASMITDLMAGVKKTLENATWMDPDTKNQALKKLEAIQVNTGFPSWIMENSHLDRHYKNLTVDSSADFFYVFNNLTAWQHRESAYKLAAPVDRSDFLDSPATVNAWYAAVYNSITVPAGILQGPAFQAHYPSSVRFGAIGSIIGHELMHGFDQDGVQFGSNGSLSDWFDHKSAQLRAAREQCLVNEYNGFCYPTVGKKTDKLCVDGLKTLPENQADNFGLEAAYRAFLDYEAENGQHAPLPGATLRKFSNKQLFFLSFASLWCSEASTEGLEIRIRYGTHSPPAARVEGVLRNMPEFLEAFDCPATSYMAMVSRDRCSTLE